MSAEQEISVIDKQTVLSLIHDSRSFWLGLILVLTIFLPVFLSNNALFLPVYFSNGFYLTIGITASCSLIVGFLLLRTSILWKFTRLDIAMGLFLVYFLIRFAFSQYTHWSQGRFVWWLALFAVYGVFRGVFSRISLRPGIWTGLMFIALTQVVVGQLQLIGLPPAPQNLFKISGTFLNPAPYSGFLAVLLPLALCRIVKRKGVHPTWQKFLAYLVVGGILLVALPAQSRSAWLALAAGAIWILVDRFQLFTLLSQWPNRRLALMTVLLMILGGIGSYWLYQFKADSASGRLLVWKVSAKMLQEKPVFGLDLTRFAPEYMLAQADYFSSGQGSYHEELLAGNIPFAYNEFLQIAVESGVIGLVLFLFIFFTAFETKERNSTSIKEVPSITSVKAALLAWLVFACFSYPLEVWGTTLLLPLLLAYLSTFGAAKLPPVSLEARTPNFLSGLMLILVTIFFAFWIWRTRPTIEHWKEGIVAYQMGEYEEARQHYAQIFDVMQYEGVYLQHIGKCLAQLGHYKKSNSSLTLAKYYYNDPILYTTMGSNYTSLQEYKKAEMAYMIAQNMIPHRIHPSYLLAQMYYSSGQPEKAVTLATKLLEKNVKVNSPAIEEMMRNLKELSLINY